MERLTEGDLDLLRYFWEGKQDIEHWIDWEAKKHLIEKEFPELMKVWQDYKISGKLMNRVLSDMCIEKDKIEYEDENEEKEDPWY